VTNGMDLVLPQQQMLSPSWSLLLKQPWLPVRSSSLDKILGKNVFVVCVGHGKGRLSRCSWASGSISLVAMRRNEHFQKSNKRKGHFH